MNCSRLSLTRLEESRSRTFTSSPTSYSPCLPAEWSAQAIKQVPKEVLEKKAKMVKSMGMIKTEDIAIMVNDGKEMFYRGLVHSMKERMDVENETPGTENLEEERKMMEEELGELRESQLCGEQKRTF